jgi:SSS family solute:Na+ symporter
LENGEPTQVFITAPKETGWFTLSMSLLGTIVGGGMFIGVAQLGYEGGITPLALGISYLMGSIMMGVLAGPVRRVLQARGVTTLFELFEVLYPTKGWVSFSGLFAIATLLVFFLMLAAQYVAIAIFLRFFWGVDLGHGILIVAAIVGGISIPLYIVTGGLRRDLITDCFQVVVISIGVGLLLARLSVNGASEHIKALPESYFHLGSGGFIFFVGSLFFVAPTFLVRFDLWQRIVTARTDEAARFGFVLSGVLSFFFFGAFGLLGLSAKAEGLSSAQFAGLDIIGLLTTDVTFPLVVIAFFAAVLSSADTFLNVASISTARVVQSVRRRARLAHAGTEFPNEKQSDVSLRVVKVSAWMVALISMLFAFTLRDIVDLFASAFGLLIAFVPGLVGGLLKSTPPQKAALWSSVVGVATVFLLTFFVPREAFLPGIALATLTYLILSRMSGSKEPYETANQSTAST